MSNGTNPSNIRRREIVLSDFNLYFNNVVWSFPERFRCFLIHTVFTLFYVFFHLFLCVCNGSLFVKVLCQQRFFESLIFCTGVPNPCVLCSSSCCFFFRNSVFSRRFAITVSLLSSGWKRNPLLLTLSSLFVRLKLFFSVTTLFHFFLQRFSFLCFAVFIWFSVITVDDFDIFGKKETDLSFFYIYIYIYMIFYYDLHTEVFLTRKKEWYVLEKSVFQRATVLLVFLMSPWNAFPESVWFAMVSTCVFVFFMICFWSSVLLWVSFAFVSHIAFLFIKFFFVFGFLSSSTVLFLLSSSVSIKICFCCVFSFHRRFSRKSCFALFAFLKNNCFMFSFLSLFLSLSLFSFFSLCLFLLSLSLFTTLFLRVTS